MENINNQPELNKNEQSANEWENLKENAPILSLWSEVPNLKDYKISSLPFDSKEDAYNEINEHYKGEENTTTYYSGGKWYIIQK